MKNVLKYSPFVLVILLNLLVQSNQFVLENVKNYVYLITAFLLVNLIIMTFLKIRDYFVIGITFVSIVGAIFVFVSPNLGQFYIENLIASMYFGLFLAAAVPPLLKLKPFTFEYSENKYPKVITKTNSFLTINLIINYMWAFLFAIAILLTVLDYGFNSPWNEIVAQVLPVLLMLLVGAPLTNKLPSYLKARIKTEPIIFNSIYELFEAMPHGLNKEKAANINTIIQFHLTGLEPFEGYLTIKNQKCTVTKGKHPNPKTTILSDSALWLQISNNEVSGFKSLLNGAYKVEGDKTIMPKFANLFSDSEPEKKKTFSKRLATIIKK